MSGAVDRIEQIRRAHAHAKPKPVNPAWQNAHVDLGFALQHIDTLRAQLEAAEAERDRAMFACKQLGERLTATKARAEAAEAEVSAIKQAITDPENQPSQFGTVLIAARIKDVKKWQ